MVKLRRRIARHALIGLDTSVWIYHLEENARYLPLTSEVLNQVQTGRPRGIISVLTLMELIVRPYRLDQPDVAAHYEALLSRFPNLMMVDVTQTVARRAAQLRGAYAIRAVDATLVATTLVAGGTAWVTNDRALGRLTPLLDVIVLDDFLETERRDRS